MFDAREKHIRLRRVVVDDSAGANGGGEVAEVVELPGDPVDDEGVAGRRVAAVDGDGAGQPDGVGRVVVVQVDRVAAGQAVDDQVGLITELNRLEVIDTDQAVGRDRALRVVDGVVRGGAVDRERRLGNGVERRGQA